MKRSQLPALRTALALSGVIWLVAGCEPTETTVDDPPFDLPDGGGPPDTTAPGPVNGVSDEGDWLGRADVFTVSWGAASDDVGVTGYDVALGTTEGGTDTRDFTPTGAALQATLDSLNLQAGVTYFASVRARDEAGNRGEPRSSDGITVDLAPPGQSEITDEGEWSRDNTRLQASWTEASDDVGVTGYELAVGSEAGESDISVTDEAPEGWHDVGLVTSGAVEGLRLRTGRSYFVAVRAYDAMGRRGAVAAADGIKIDTAPPGAPAITEGPLEGWHREGQVRAAWSAATDNVAIAGYQVALGVGETPNPELGEIWTDVGDVDNHLFEDTLVDGESYVIAVRAYDAAGLVGEAATALPFRQDATPPSTPTVEDGRDWLRGNEDLELQWEPATDNLEVAGYIVAIAPQAGGAAVVGPTEVGAVTSYVFEAPQLQNGSAFVATVRAVDAAGNRGGAARSDGFTVDAEPPGAPVAVTDDGIYTARSDRLRAEWRPASDGGVIATYEVSAGRTGVGGQDIRAFEDVGLVDEVLLTELMLIDGVSYQVCVRARDAAGNTGPSACSDGIVVDTTSPSPPMAVTDAGEYTATPDSFTVDWEGGGDAVGLEHWEIAAFANPSLTAVVADWQAIDVTAGPYTLPVTTPLEDGERILVCLRGVDRAGNPPGDSACSDGIVVDTTPPGAPTEVQDAGVYSNNLSGLRVRWAAATDNLFVAGYEIEVATTTGFVARAYAPPPAEAQVDDEGRLQVLLEDFELVGDQTYLARVRAFDGTGAVGVAAESDGITIDLDAPTAPGAQWGTTFWATPETLSAELIEATDFHHVAGYVATLSGELRRQEPDGSETVLDSRADVGALGSVEAPFVPADPDAPQLPFVDLALEDAWSYTAEVAAVDGAGNLGPAGSSPAVIIDASPPALVFGLRRGEGPCMPLAPGAPAAIDRERYGPRSLCGTIGDGSPELRRSGVPSDALRVSIRTEGAGGETLWWHDGFDGAERGWLEAPYEGTAEIALESDTETGLSDWHYPGLPRLDLRPGFVRYFVELRVSDRAGHEVTPPALPLVIDDPLRLSAPSPSLRLGAPTQLQWDADPIATGYFIELVRFAGGDFHDPERFAEAQPVAGDRVDDPRWDTPADLPPGFYFYRVAVERDIDGEAVRGAWSQERYLRIADALPVPRVAVADATVQGAALACPVPEHCLLAGSPAVFTSDDVGLRWQPQAGTPALQRSRSLAMADAQRAYLAHDGGVLRSDDGGLNFRRVTPAPVAGVPFHTVVAVSRDQVFALTETQVWFSFDAGQSWIDATPEADLLYKSVACSNEGAGCLLAAGGDPIFGAAGAHAVASLFRVANLTPVPDPLEPERDTLDWQTLGPLTFLDEGGAAFDGEVYGGAVSRAGDAWLLGGNGDPCCGSGGIWRSADGVVWNRVADPASERFRRFIWRGGGVGYAISAGAVYRSEDSAQSWVKLSVAADGSALPRIHCESDDDCEADETCRDPRPGDVDVEDRSCFAIGALGGECRDVGIECDGGLVCDAAADRCYERLALPALAVASVPPGAGEAERLLSVGERRTGARWILDGREPEGARTVGLLRAPPALLRAERAAAGPWVLLDDGCRVGRLDGDGVLTPSSVVSRDCDSALRNVLPAPGASPADLWVQGGVPWRSTDGGRSFAPLDLTGTPLAIDGVEVAALSAEARDGVGLLLRAPGPFGAVLARTDGAGQSDYVRSERCDFSAPLLSVDQVAVIAPSQWALLAGGRLWFTFDAGATVDAFDLLDPEVPGLGAALVPVCEPTQRPDARTRAELSVPADLPGGGFVRVFSSGGSVFARSADDRLWVFPPGARSPVEVTGLPPEVGADAAPLVDIAAGDGAGALLSGGMAYLTLDGGESWAASPVMLPAGREIAGMWRRPDGELRVAFSGPGAAVWAITP